MKFGDEVVQINRKQVKIARAISRITSAPLVNLYVGIIFAFMSPIGLGPMLDAFAAILICVILMVLLPILPIIIQAWRGIVDLDVSKRELRLPFFLFTLVCYAIAFCVYLLTECIIMQVLTGAYIIVTSSVSIASLKWKVSVHGAGVGGPGMALIFVYGVSALPVIFLWIIVIWSRTILQQHTAIQATAGVLLGIIFAWLTYFLIYPI